MVKILEKYGTVFLTLFCIGLLTFINVIHGPFLLDDQILIVRNEYVHSLSYFFEYFTTNALAGANEMSDFYRPIAILSYAIIYKFFGANYIVFHLVNIGVHIINGFLVYLLLKRFKFSDMAALLTALIFLVHPVQAETVSYISGLPDLLSSMMLLLGLLIYTNLWKVKRSGVRILKTLFVFSAFVLALLAKESAIVFFPLAALISVYQWSDYKKKDRKFYLKVVFGLVLLGITYLILKFTVFKFTDAFGLLVNGGEYNEHLYFRLTTFAGILFEYFKAIFYPVHLFFEKPIITYETFLNYRVIIGGLGVLVGLVLSYFSFKRKKLFFLSYFWFFLAMIPFIGIVPLNATYMDHWLYIPLIGVLIGLVAGIYDLLKKEKSRKFFLVIVIALIIVLTLRTMDRNREWASPRDFFMNEIASNPYSPRLYPHVAKMFADEGLYDIAIEYYNIGISLADVLPHPHLNLSLIYEKQGLVDKQVDELFKALYIKPTFISPYHALWNMFNEEGDQEKVEKIESYIEIVGKGGDIAPEQVSELRNHLFN